MIPTSSPEQGGSFFLFAPSEMASPTEAGDIKVWFIAGVLLGSVFIGMQADNFTPEKLIEAFELVLAVGIIALVGRKIIRDRSRRQ